MSRNDLMEDSDDTYNLMEEALKKFGYPCNDSDDTYKGTVDCLKDRNFHDFIRDFTFPDSCYWKEGTAREVSSF